MKNAAQEFEKLERKNCRIYPAMDEIFKFLNDNNIEPIIISGSQNEALETFGTHMNIRKST